MCSSSPPCGGNGNGRWRGIVFAEFAGGDPDASGAASLAQNCLPAPVVGQRCRPVGEGLGKQCLVVGVDEAHGSGQHGRVWDGAQYRGAVAGRSGSGLIEREGESNLDVLKGNGHFGGCAPVVDRIAAGWLRSARDATVGTAVYLGRRRPGPLPIFTIMRSSRAWSMPVSRSQACRSGRASCGPALVGS